MKKAIILAIVLAASVSGLKAQILNPVKWGYGAKIISKTEAIVFFRATIDRGWHLYSQTVKDGGPVKTSFTFESSDEYTLTGKTVEPQSVTKFEKVFGMNVSYFEREVIFQQKVKLKASKTTVKGTLEYMTCNDRQCLPPNDVTFSIVVK